MNQEKPSLSFILLVQTGAIVNDLRHGRGLAVAVVERAMHVPESALPRDLCEAAEGYLNYMYGLCGEERPEWLPDREDEE